MIRFYLSMLIAALLTLYLLIVLIFGTIEKHHKRNRLGLRVGKIHYYFILLNGRMRVSTFLILYACTLAFAGYEFYLYSQ